MRQILVLGVALLAAVAALFLVRGMAVKAPAPEKSKVVVTNGIPVLVVNRALEQGDTAQPSDLAWVNFPPETMSENYIQQPNAPKAVEDYAGAIARFPIDKGEPVTPMKLLKPGEQGFMAAMLKPGYRAVAVPITDEAAAAGFIMPNDRVDVLVTRRMSGGEDARTNTILEDVRVLAIDGHYRAPVQDKEPTAMAGNVATLELTPADAEMLAMADKMGDIALVLRGVRDDPQAVSSRRKAGQPMGAVKIHNFGRVTETTVKATAGAEE